MVLWCPLSLGPSISMSIWWNFFVGHGSVQYNDWWRYAVVRVVWSFWSKPYFVSRHSAWVSETHHLLSWVLSVQCARRFYPDTILITDDEGARILVDGIGLPFRSVSTALNALQRHDPALWSMGKLYAYRNQTEPFIHIDNDVFLWERMNPSLEVADILAQNEEPFRKSEFRYRPEELEKVVNSTEGAWIPHEWLWYRSSGEPQKGICCGIFGGTRVDFARYYAALAIRLVEDPINRSCWFRLGHVSSGLLFEQYLLAACLEYHRFQSSSPFAHLQVAYVLNFQNAASRLKNAVVDGYEHLMGEAKRNTARCDRLRRCVMQDYPYYYERCLRYTQLLGS